MLLFFSCFLFLDLFRFGLSTSLYEINEKSSDRAILYGDILISPKQLKFRKLNGRKDVIIKERWNNRWADNVVPYILSSQYSQRERAIIRGAFTQLEQNSCFRFVERTNQRDYLDVKKLDGCFSYVGKIGGRQLISLGDGCVYDFIILHEVLHVLGMEHEHQRPDRDSYIKVIYENVQPDKMLNFEKIPFDQVDLHGHPYDYKSIGVELVDNYELTELDYAKLRILGKCPEHKSKIPKKQSCYDKSPTFCERIKLDGLCENTGYKILIQDHCALTCGYCNSPKGHDEKCADKHEECGEYVKRGFCSLSFDDSTKFRQLCAESCGLCSKGTPSA